MVEMEECLMCLCDLRVPLKLKGIFLSDIGITDDVVHDRCFILVFGCQTLIAFEPFQPVISYFFLGREKVSKTLENRGPGVVFATGRC
jgi:hypothetical protein